MILPTIGRETLSAALDSCSDADEVVLVIDGGWEPQEPFSENVRVLRVDGRDRGYTARTAGMAAATGTHLAFLDDDDVYAAGALDVMRAAACDWPVIFRMDDPYHGVIWRKPELSFGNVGTPMILVPNDPARLGVWEPFAPELESPGGDFSFISGCVEKMGGPVWRDEIVAVVRPHARRRSIAVVTPMWNHPANIPDFMAAIEAGRPDELIVVDNGSTPPVGLPGIRLERNTGFSHACNVGLAAAKSDAVLFLNDDIAMTSPDWLDRIRDAVEPGLLVGAQLRYDAHADVDGERFPYLDGWCLAGMRDDLLELGGFDESYDEPAYYVENDLCLRARAAGMSLREVRVGLRHKLNVSANDHPNVAAASAANRERYVAAARDLLREPVAA